MKRAMREYNLNPPIFDEPGPNFMATFFGPGARFMRELEIQPEWMNGLNDRQIKAVEYLAEQGKITNYDYRQMFVVSSRTATKELTDLMRKKLVKRQGTGRSTVYIFTPELT
jgi:ATP-dependent DNA helicase RecG